MISIIARSVRASSVARPYAPLLLSFLFGWIRKSLADTFQGLPVFRIIQSVETGHTDIVVQVCYLDRPTCWIGGGSQYKILVAFSGAAGHRVHTLDYGRFETFACKPIEGPLRVLFHNVVQNANDLFIKRIDLIHDTH